MSIFTTLRRGIGRQRQHRARLGLLLTLLLAILAVSGCSRNESLEGKLEREAAQRIVELTNAVRRDQSLALLLVDPHLTRAAEQYAEVMAQQDWFDHPGPDGSTVVERAEAAGYVGWAYLGENLARDAGPADPASIVEGWMRSEGHRRNLLSPDLGDTGVGCYVRAEPDLRFWCVQNFGTRQARP